jgi:hypothetical protein
MVTLCLCVHAPLIADLLSLNVMGSLAAASWVLLLPPAWLREVLYLVRLSLPPSTRT